MRFHPRILSSAAALAITCVVSAAAYYYRSRNKEINEVMVFCKLQLNAFNCFDKLISHIEAAKHSVSVCMPGIHNTAIQGRLLEIMKTKKITVRIIVDRNGYRESTDFFIKELTEAGAEIRCKVNESVYRMRHKFCLVDDHVLMTGTLNWGNDLSSDHWNYVYITSKRQLVEPVKQSFYQMWNNFSSDMASLEEQSNTIATLEDQSNNKSTFDGQSNTIASLEDQSNTVATLEGQSNKTATLEGQSNTTATLEEPSNTTVTLGGSPNTIPFLKGQFKTIASFKVKFNTNKKRANDSGTDITPGNFNDEEARQVALLRGTQSTPELIFH